MPIPLYSVRPLLILNDFSDITYENIAYSKTQLQQHLRSMNIREKPLN
jgi:hypothetical protein